MSVKSKKLYEGFVKEVLSGKKQYSKTIIQLCEQYVENLKRKDIWFDHEEACKHIDFIKLIPLASEEFAGELIEVQGWQAFLVANIYGWYKEVKERGKVKKIRKIRRVYLQVARKNSKTTIAAILAIDNAIKDPSKGSDIFFAATSRTQANICFDMAKDISDETAKWYPSFKAVYQPWAHSIEFTNWGTFLKPVSAEAKTIEGEGAKMAIVDEVHEHQNRKVINSIAKGMVKHDNPLMVLITTAGYNKQPDAPAYQMYRHSKKVLNKDIEDDSLFPMIFELDEEDDWKDETKWTKANPLIGLSPKWENIRDAYKEAISLGGAMEVDFKIKHLNLWVDSDVTWINKEKWESNQHPLPDFDKRISAYGGLDLAKVEDMCSLCINIPYRGQTYLLWRYYLPESKLQSKSPMVIQYGLWKNAGILTVTPGDTTDYRYIFKDVCELYKQYNVKAIAYDEYGSSQLIVELLSEGINMVPMRQNMGMMSPPTKDFQKRILDGLVQHGNNPISTWQLGNVRIKTNATDQIMISKGMSHEKVDGMVAAVMSIECENVFRNKKEVVIDLNPLII